MLAIGVVEAEREGERLAVDLAKATEDAVADAKAGTLPAPTGCGLLAAVSGKAAVLDGVLLKVAERRAALAAVAEAAKRAG